MTLYERYIRKDTFELLEILEHYKDYTQECIDVIWEIYEFRELTKELVIDDILLINRRIIRKKLEKFNPLHEKLELHESNFLEPKEMKELYQTELKKFIDKQDHFGFDVWSYAIGGL